ncbi:MAG TPA: ABC transporter permease [Longimicrobiales bacterium]|nr:ABC transporter permease [Longimicrobiales bacterium]
MSALLVRVGRSLVRLAFVAFPADFRQAYRTDALIYFADRARACARRGGAPSVLWLIVTSVLSTLSAGLAERVAQKRSGRGGGILRDGLLDLRYALVSLGKHRSFSLVVVVTLALGIGLTTAVAGVVWTVVLAPPPYPEPDAIVQVARVRDGRRAVQLPPADVQRVAEATSGALSLAVSRFQDVGLSTEGAPERLRAVLVTASTLDAIGIEPARGRLPDTSDELGSCTAVLSHAVWENHLGTRPDVVGGTVRLDGASCEVLGVMPPDFAYPAPYFAGGDIWLLASPASVDWTAEGGPGFLVFGRLAPGVERAAVQERLDAAAGRDPEMDTFQVMSWAAPSREASRQRLLTLLAAAGLVFVIALVNVVTLQIARGADRMDEIATRMALGASRFRLMRMLFVEAAVLSLAGGAMGLLVATWSVDLIVSLRSFYIPRMNEVRMDAGAVLTCFVLTAVAGVLVSALPAARLAHSKPLVGSAGRGRTAGRSGRLFGRALVTVETSLALILLAGAALLTESYRGLASLDPGFNADRVLHARVTPPATRYPDDRARAASIANWKRGSLRSLESRGRP